MYLNLQLPLMGQPYNPFPFLPKMVQTDYRNPPLPLRGQTYNLNPQIPPAGQPLMYVTPNVQTAPINFSAFCSK